MSFRMWIQEVWRAHVEELWQWDHKRPTYDSKEYFNKYKWWLRREYKHRTANNTLTDF